MESLKLDAPLVPDDAYVRFLNENRGDVHSVHFSLRAEVAADARVPMGRGGVERLIGCLRALNGPRKYGLLNGRFHSEAGYGRADIKEPATLRRDRANLKEPAALGRDRANFKEPAALGRDRANLKGLAALLDRMVGEGGMDGIVFADAYLLMALSDAAPETAGALEAVPSVNCAMDGAGRVGAMLDLIGETRFRFPERITLDRSLNRRPERLRAVAGECRRRWPGLKISLLVNEGCLDLCPFKPAHDAHIALINTGVHMDTLGLNQELGCMRALRRAPHRIFQSPIIRPEDAGRYAGVADILKICGRTLGAGFLRRAVTAYIKGRFDGSLPALTDAMHWMADHYDIPNRALPADFWDRLTACGGDCGAVGADRGGNCGATGGGRGYCEELFDAIARPLAPGLGDLRR